MQLEKDSDAVKLWGRSRISKNWYVTNNGGVVNKRWGVSSDPSANYEYLLKNKLLSDSLNNKTVKEDIKKTLDIHEFTK